MAVACLAEGASYIRETIYDGRYTLVGELNKMGAKVELDRGAVIVHGPATLKGAHVVAHDLRTGIALVLAGLAAEGETTVTPGYPIDRGHAAIAQRFSALGADITAIPALPPASVPSPPSFPSPRSSSSPPSLPAPPSLAYFPLPPIAPVLR
jgi:UDP-N-acetylglucosamine enolpyruvyl transferase